MKPILIPIALIMLLCFGCRKKKPDPGLINIYTSGCPFVGNTQFFSVIAASDIQGADVAWAYGDGTFSATGNHIYKDPGTYTVTASINGYSMSRAYTVTSQGPESPYTARLARLRHWVGSFSGVYTANLSTVTIDTDWALESNTPGTVIVPFVSAPGAIYEKRELSMVSMDTVEKVLFFCDCATNRVKITYYYDADSIVYSYYWNASVGHGYQHDELHTVK